MNWNKSNIKNLKILNPEALESSGLSISKTSKEKSHINKILWVFLYEKLIDDYETEYKFHPKRKFRFDWAIPSIKVAIEYEGIVSDKSRHTSLQGYTNDCNKYNLAISMGWRVLRYTALNYSNLNEDLKNFI